MPARGAVHYFGAGPASLPTSILETASAAILNYEGTGVGLIEQSHRSASSTGIIASAVTALETLLEIPKTHTVLFMQGGGTTQFSAVVYNLVGFWAAQALKAHNGDIAAVKSELAKTKADYLVTGSWSKKAAEEAVRLLDTPHVNIAADSRKMSSGKFGEISDENTWTLTPVENSFYTYFCDNETVDGVEFPSFPTSLSNRLVATDLSSNILSRRVNIADYALLFAGAQKNVGGAGVTIVIVRFDILQNQPTPSQLRALDLPVPPVMLHYPPLVKAESLYNTLPIFDVFICREVMHGLISRGGLAVQESLASKKSAALYSALDAAGERIFRVVPARNARSRMNICFRIKNGDETAEKQFLKGAEERGLTGLRGHRSVGGLRISNYNSISERAVEKVVDWINEFAAGC